ncbi:MAG: M48 family metallopeptidase [Clostridia bacterium]|nr:M48 family metallopeptidase [Clostridia bacterium]MBR0081123.1 M48 family metallopeptidase [Clostridia bacterium]
MGWKIGIVVIVTIVYLYELFLTRLALRSEHNPIPPCVSDVYDADTYRTRQRYSAEKNRLKMLRSTVVFAVDLALLLSNAYAAFAGVFPKDAWMQMFAVLLLNIVSTVVELPFSYYDTMHIEEKYGFNRTDRKTFVVDSIKEFVLQFLLIVGLGSMVFGMHQSFGDWLILVFAVFATLFVLFISFLYPFFSRIFNKFTPLEDGELKEKLTALLEKNGYHVRAIHVMDASRRSSKANAYFAGFGKMKTIVLYDTLLEAMTTDEICAVFAHEMGHGLHKDTLKTHILSFAQMLILGTLAWLTLRTPALFKAFGFSEVNYGFALILIMSAEFALIQPLFGLLSNAFSRRAEYRADAHAVQEGYGEELISGLKKLARANYGDLSPSPLLVALEYSHPTLAQRIEAIRAKEAKDSAA